MQYTPAQLPYSNQSGALLQSIADVFGSMVKQWANNETVDQADWLIGEKLFSPGFKGRALRDMANPGTAYDDPSLGKDAQPAHMKDYVKTDDDNGGVHINVGIPNRAFVLAARAVGGRSWEGVGKIWYIVATQKTAPDADFAKFAHETVSVAKELYPRDPTIAARVQKAWADVGVVADVPASSATR
jgi:Zn-dependent metalloprotease